MRRFPQRRLVHVHRLYDEEVAEETAELMQQDALLHRLTLALKRAKQQGEEALALARQSYFLRVGWTATEAHCEPTRRKSKSPLWQM